MINGNLSNGADLEAHEMSKLPLVLGIATALPERVVSTEELTEDFIEIMQADDRASELARKIGKTCGITTRYSCMQLEEFKNTPSMLTLGAASLNDRMALFEKHAVPLARAAGEKALSEWGRERSEITHVITFSTSGILVAGAVDPFVRELVGELDYEELLWAVHPGGKAIVDSTEKGCNLSPGKLQVSRDVLATFSNMASATVLFVLDQVRKDNAAKAGKHWTLALGFGPGITVEGSLLRLVNN
eukprot:jgi/Mesen1/4552/ME000232S03808